MHEQTKLGPKWRHLCLESLDMTVPLGPRGATIEVPREILVQGTAHVNQKLLIADKFQGAYVCELEVVVPPVNGTLQFIGDGWFYKPKKLPAVGDSFQYIVKANSLESAAATVNLV